MSELRRRSAHARRVLGVAYCIGLGACGSPVGQGPRETGDMEVGEAEASSDASASSDEGAPLCIPGTERCSGEDLEVCAATGLSWELRACEGAATCRPCEPMDEDPRCETAAAICSGPCDEMGAPTHAGCSFVTVWLPFGDAQNFASQTLEVLNPDASETTAVRLQRVALGTREEVDIEGPVELGPGEVVRWPLAAPDWYLESSEFRTGDLYRVVSDRPVHVAQTAPASGTNPAVGPSGGSSLLLPERSFRGDFVVPSAVPKPGSGILKSYFTVVALENDTVVSWTPRVATTGDSAPIPPAEPDQTVSVSMNRYDQVRIAGRRLSDAPGEFDLSGTVISATRPVTVFSGVPCAIPQPTAQSCDHLQEQLLPLGSWGRRHVVARPLPRGQGTGVEEPLNLRIFAGEADLHIDELGGALGGGIDLAERGDWVDLRLDMAAEGLEGLDLRGDGAFLVVQFLDARRHFGISGVEEPYSLLYGDSAMVQHPPVEQWQRRYTFATDATWPISVLQVVRPIGGPEVTIDGTPLGPWLPLAPTGAQWERAEWTPPAGEAVHSVVSTEPVGVTLYGHGALASLPGSLESGHARMVGVGVADLFTP